MQSYLTPAGLALLQVALNTVNAIPSIKFTGLQVGSAAGFTPDSTLTTAQGDILVDAASTPAAVRLTKLQLHELILTAVIDRKIELTAVGNVLFFANNTPFLWLVADDAFPKLGLDPIAHFAGDECYLSLIFRFPYIQRLISLPLENGLHAKLPVFNTTHNLTIPQHTLADQCLVEQNNLYYGGNKPFLAARSRGLWLSIPFMGKPVDKNFYKIDGGQAGTGL
jgi:hypothetical protein